MQFTEDEDKMPIHKSSARECKCKYLEAKKRNLPKNLAWGPAALVQIV